MTFAEYNTDENFDRKESSLDELVKIGIGEGKTSDEIRNSLSPKWQKSKKIGEFDNYYKKYAAPKEEAPKTEEKPVEEVFVEDETETEPKAEKLTAPALSKGDAKYINDQRKRSENAEVAELNKIVDRSDYNYKSLYDTTRKMSDAYKNIDDKLVAQFPTFMFKRFHNGEFGDPKSSDAKLRLAHFMINGVGTALQNASAAIKGGAMQESDIQKYNRTNLEQGLENRWKKYKAETDNAIALASKETMSEQEARLAVEQLTRNQNMNTMWNTMNENQKLYAMEVTKKIGDFIGNMDISELADFIAGAAYEGKMDKDKVVAIGIAKLAEKYPDILNGMKDGSMKDTVLSFLGTNATAGIGGGTNSNGNQTNLAGNIKDYQTIGGETISFDFTDPNAGKKIKAVYDDLIKRYKDGEIDAATFKQYYDPMYTESKKHPGSVGTFFSGNSDSALSKANKEVIGDITTEFEELNTKANNGELSPSVYEEKYEALKTKAIKFGADGNMLKAVDKKKLDNKTILKAVDKKNRKK